MTLFQFEYTNSSSFPNKHLYFGVTFYKMQPGINRSSQQCLKGGRCLKGKILFFSDVLVTIRVNAGYSKNLFF